MGLRGPAPVPNADRLAPHTGRQLDTPAAAGAAALPTDETWHPEAQLWYEQLADTPQAGEYTASDWAYAHACAAIFSRALRSGDLRAALEVIKSADQRLMTTRPARLAARLDLDELGERPEGEVLELPTNDQLRERTFGIATG